MKKLLVIALLTIGSASALIASTCVACGTVCTVCAYATIPTGGSCVITENPCTAVAKTYTANGELYDWDTARCYPMSSCLY